MKLPQNVRLALRRIGKTRWFSAAIIATLALGIGINTTVFSLVNAVLLKPLPFPGGERLAATTSSTCLTPTSGISAKVPSRSSVWKRLREPK